MNRWTCALGALAIAMTWSATACAGSMTLKQTVKPIHYAYPGVSLDVVGLELGMTPQQAVKALASYTKANPNITNGTVGAQYKDVSVTSQKFKSEISVDNGDHDEIYIYFGGPVFGNRSLSIKREISFPNPKTAPTLKAVIAALKKKYGAVTKTSISPTPSTMLWVFGQHELKASCSQSADQYCNAISQMFDVAGVYTYSPGQKNGGVDNPGQKSRSSGNYVYIEADISAQSSDPSRISDLTVSLTDQRGEADTFDATMQQMYAAAVAAYGKNKPEAPPKL